MPTNTDNPLICVSRLRVACPICGKRDWCSVSKDGADAVCMRPPPAGCSPLAITRNDGHYYRLKDMNRPRVQISQKAIDEYDSTPEPTIDCHYLQDHFRYALTQDRVDAFYKDVKSSCKESIHGVGIGWCGWAYTAPMYDAHETPIGFRVRKPGGQVKVCIPGSRNGLFLAPRVPIREPVLIVEGMTDAITACTLDFSFIGRPSATGGRRLIADYLRLHRIRSVAIIPDNDEPDAQGRRVGTIGATTLATYLRDKIHSIKLVYPRVGKDLKDWFYSLQLTKPILSSIIANANEWTPDERTRQWA